MGSVKEKGGKALGKSSRYQCGEGGGRRGEKMLEALTQVVARGEKTRDESFWSEQGKGEAKTWGEQVSPKCSNGEKMQWVSLDERPDQGR